MRLAWAHLTLTLLPKGFTMLRLLALLLAIAAVAFWFIFADLAANEPADAKPTKVTPDPVPAEAVSDADAPAVGPVGDLEAIECQRDVDRWDSCKRAAIKQKCGENAEAVVEGCRAIVAPPAP